MRGSTSSLRSSRYVSMISSFLLIILPLLCSTSWAFQLALPAGPVHQAARPILGRRPLCRHSRLFSIGTNQDEPPTLLQDEILGDSSLDDDDAERLDDVEGTLTADDVLDSLPQGTPQGFYVVEQYKVADSPIDWSPLDLEQGDIDRLSLTPQNVSLPIALMLLDPEQFPSVSRARKACRKGAVLIHRGPLSVDEKTGLQSVFNATKCIRGRVGDRVLPGDVLGKQVRMGSGGHYLGVANHRKPPFELPVVYEDDHFALVNKPAGVVVYSHRKGGHGIMTVRAALPFTLTPPKAGTYSILRRPTAVHRLDKPTSGILCVAKTKPAMLDLSRQFRERVVKKSYTAIVNGIPAEENQISSETAFEMGVDVDPNDESRWQLIDYTLEEKSAVTVWRAIRYAKSFHARDGYLTQVELKPKTGRYHQLRRHLAWVTSAPIVGDGEYDEGTQEAMRFRDRGLFLCSNRFTLEHPFYNSEEGRPIWEALDDEDRYANGMISLSSDGRVVVEASIDIPAKFESLLTHEEERYAKLADQLPSE